MKKKVKAKFELKERCETCGNTSGLTRSHFVKESSVHNSHEYDYEAKENWCTMCIHCHMAYERLPIRKKLDRGYYGNNRTVTRQEYMMRKGLFQYANRIEVLVNEKK